MTTIGYLLILASVIVTRLAISGRNVSTLPGDVGDLVIAAVQGRYDDVSEVLRRTGDAYTPSTGADALTGSEAGRARGGTFGDATMPAGGSQAGRKLLAAVVRRGSGRKYVLGATGPSTYDCSGLVWRGMQDIGLNVGARWTTHTWKAVAQRLGAQRVSTPAVGDIVWWPGHVGVVDNPTAMTYFSARSPKYGINSSSIDLTTRSRGASGAEYWRLP